MIPLQIADPVHPKLPEYKGAYIIYDPAKGKYSRGGTMPNWSMKPKIWSSWGALKLHLAQFIAWNFDKHDGATSYLDRKKVYRLVNFQPYSTECYIHDIVSNLAVGNVHAILDEMIAARKKQDLKDQDKRTREMIEQIKKRNDDATA